jgi:hypothetical protein
VLWGVATVGNGPVWVSTPLAPLEVAPSYLALSLERAAGEQGGRTTLYGKVQVATPWEGEAKVKLVGLPPGAEAPEVTLTKDSKEVPFPLTIAKTTPAGVHRNLFCQVTVTQNGEPVTHNLGSGELRVDVPLVAKAEPAKPAAATPKPAEKRLSRLEQLRKEQEEREKAQKKD